MLQDFIRRQYLIQTGVIVLAIIGLLALGTIIIDLGLIIIKMIFGV